MLTKLHCKMKQVQIKNNSDMVCSLQKSLAETQVQMCLMLRGFGRGFVLLLEHS